MTKKLPTSDSADDAGLQDAAASRRAAASHGAAASKGATASRTRRAPKGAAANGQPKFYDLYRDPVDITPLTADERATLRLINQRVAALPTLDDVIDRLFERTAGIFPFDRLGLSFVRRRRPTRREPLRADHLRQDVPGQGLQRGPA